MSLREYRVDEFPGHTPGQYSGRFASGVGTIRRVLAKVFSIRPDLTHEEFLLGLGEKEGLSISFHRYEKRIRLEL